MRASLIFSIFVLVLGELQESRERRAVEVASLELLTSSLSTFSRVASSISLQSNLPNIPSGRFLHLSHPDTLDKLKNNISFENLETLEKTLKLTRGFAKGVRNESEVKESAQILKDLIAKKDELLGAATSDLNGYIKKIQNVLKVNISMLTNSSIVSVDECLDKLVHIYEPSTFTNEEVEAVKNAALKFAILFENYENDINKLKGYQTSLKVLVNFKDEDKVMEKTQTLLKASEKFNNSKIDILKSDFEVLHNDTKSFLALQGNKSQIDGLILTLREVLQNVNELRNQSSNSQNSDSIIPGTMDLSKVYEADLKSTWLQKTVAQDYEDLQILVTLLEPLQKLLPFLKELEESYKEIGIFNETEISGLEKVAQILENSQNLSMSVNFTEQEGFLEKSKTCLELVKKSSNPVNVAEFNEMFQFSDELVQNVSKVMEILKEVTDAPEISNFRMMRHIWHIIDYGIERIATNMHKFEILMISERITDLPEISKFRDNFKVTANKMRSMQKHLKILSTQIASEKFATLLGAQRVLNDTGVFEILECLNKEHFDTKIEESYKLLNASKLMETQEKLPDDSQKVLEIVGKLREVREKVKKLEEKTTKSRRRREIAPPFSPAAQKSADSLASGVFFLQNFVKVAQSNLSEFAKLDDSIHAKISNIPKMTPIWTLELREQLKEFPLEVQSVEKNAEELMKTPENLEEIFKIFQVLSHVKGVQIDGKLFGDPIEIMFRNSNEPENADYFHELKDLDLDYAAHSGAFDGAGKSLKELQKYFEELFPRKTTSLIVEKTTENLEEVARKIQDEHAEEEASQMYFIIVLVVIVLLVIVAFLVYFFVLRKKKQSGDNKNFDLLWRYLRFLEEGHLLPKDDVEYTPLHLAVLTKNFDEVKIRIKNGADVNVHSLGKVNETPLHTAVNLEIPEIIEILLKNGADLRALNENYETPKDLARGKPRIQQVLREHKDKQFQRVPPKEFPSEKFRIYLDESLRGSAEVGSNMQNNMVDKLEQATHIIVKTENDGILDLDVIKQKQGDARMTAVLRSVFSHRIVMSAKWLEAAKLRPTDFQNDFKFRVKEIRFKGEVYGTMDGIQEDFQKMKIPYLTNSVVHFAQGALHTIDWNDLKGISVALGASVVAEFPTMQALLPGHSTPYYRDDLGHVFVVFLETQTAELKEKHPMLRSDKAYNFMERDEFIAFLLAHKIQHKKLQNPAGSAEPSKDSKSKSKTITSPDSAPSAVSAPKVGSEEKSSVISRSVTTGESKEKK